MNSQLIPILKAISSLLGDAADAFRYDGVVWY